MTRIQYDYDRFSSQPLKWMKNEEDAIETVAIINGILDDYAANGYTPILRQLYYKLLGRGYFTENSHQTYKNLGNLITKARNNGLISWKALQDQHRSVNGIWRHEENDIEVVTGLESLLSLDYWKRQDNYVEVWIEKDSLIQLVAHACIPLKVPYMATKGYLSATMAQRAGQRFKYAREQGKSVTMIHLADHDPEGIDMTRDNRDRLIKYSEGHVDVQRIGLNIEQVHEYNPPPNYAKASSSRYEKYTDAYGEECWELDAIDDPVIVKLIEDAVEPYVDRDVWEATEEEEDRKRFHLERLADHWDEIKDYIDELEGV